MRKTIFAFALSATALVASPAMADNNVTVTSLVTPPVPATNQWGVLPGENSADATAELSTTNVSDTDGSLHISGNRTRVQTGVQYDLDPSGPLYPTNTGIAVGSLVSLTADYIVNNGGTGGIQSPAFRILIQDGAQRSELIWEAAYNGGYTVGSMDSLTATDIFWQSINGVAVPGTTFGYTMHTLADWATIGGYSSNAFVSGLSVGAGGGAGLTFDANVDNIALTTINPANTSRYNFAAVPEPATWAMMLLGFGGIGASMRRQRRTNRLAQIA